MAESSDPLAALYEAERKIATALQNGDASSESASYEFLISSVKGSDQVKQLSADFIPRFHHVFPSLADNALNAQFDLVEDEKPAVRMKAIRGLEILCKNSPNYVNQVANTLAQLLTTEDPHELNIVKSTLTALFTFDAKSAYDALFRQIREGEDHSIKPANILFLRSMLDKYSKEIRTNPDLKSSVIAGLKSILTSDAPISPENASYFFGLLKDLGALRSKQPADKDSEEEKALYEETKSLLGDISSVLSTHAGVHKAFVPENDVAVQQFITSLQAAKSMQGVDVRPFMEFFFRSVAPVFDRISPALHIEILKPVAISIRSLPREDVRSLHLLPGSVELIKSQIPKASTASGDSASSSSASSSGGAKEKVNFTTAETVLFIFHQVASKSGNDSARVNTGLFVPTGQPTDFLQANEEAIKQDLLARFTSLQETTNTYATQVKEVEKKLREQQKTMSKSSTDENDMVEEKKKLSANVIAIQTAGRTVSNIKRMLEALLKKVPQFIMGNAISLSWMKQKPSPATASSSAAAPTKGQGVKRKSSGGGAPSNKGGAAASTEGGDGSNKRAKGNDGVARKQGGRGGAGGGSRRGRGGGAPGSDDSMNVEQNGFRPGSRAGSRKGSQGGSYGNYDDSTNPHQTRKRAQSQGGGGRQQGGYQQQRPARRGGGGGRGRGVRGRGRGGSRNYA